MNISLKIYWSSGKETIYSNMILGFQLILQMCVSVIPIYLTTVLWFKWFTVTTPRIFFDSEMLSIEIYIFFLFFHSVSIISTYYFWYIILWQRMLDGIFAFWKK